MHGADDLDRQTPLLPRLLAPLRQRWWLMPLGALLVTALMLVYLLRAQPVWTAEMQVYPAPATAGVAARRGLAGLASQAGGGLAALTGSLGGGDSAPPFRYFLDGLTSAGVAEQLASDEALLRQMFPAEWDAAGRRWRQPESLRRSIRDGLFGLFGLPIAPWTPPDAARVREFVAAAGLVRTSVRSPLVSISLSHPDRAFATLLLTRVVAAADDELRAAARLRAEGNIRYLTDQLRSARSVDMRETIVTSLSEEERGAMLSMVPLPFAAETFIAPHVGRWPTSPRPLPLLLAALVVGVLLGATTAFWLGWRSRHRRAAATAF
ncbi:hypothetical protein GCM10007973_15600 [Polymorphobacter multimanifer]|uniref:Wzz/FepE/Etk N-terminal domain-containing protein n=1 Tax=Polymorphobacter multimanifer TaxID=1070431 RepID=UPI0016680085|nr:Wzz/FepE/Etk N-terminal domain-containing protein [Polymorphobacter multimanifer]GGI79880.1 hypothetical protein GCM10007973_15600 [Polymorphobacter multimanifer]